MEDFARAVGFSAALEDAIAAELRPWAGGTAVLEPGLPDTWDLNFLRLEEPWDGDPTAFVETVEEAARAFGMRTPWSRSTTPRRRNDSGARLPRRGTCGTASSTWPCARRPANPHSGWRYAS